MLAELLLLEVGPEREPKMPGMTCLSAVGLSILNRTQVAKRVRSQKINALLLDRILSRV